MIKHIITSIFVVFTLISFAQSENNYTLEFEIRNVKSADGFISAALFKGETNFPHKDKAYKHISVQSRNGKVTIQFKNIPKGEYALAIFHDENGNKELDTNFIGIPKEGYAFSNNMKPRFGPPNYKGAKFRISGDYYSTLYLAY